MRIVVGGLGCALVLAQSLLLAACSEDVHVGQSPEPDARASCRAVITDEVLATLDWPGRADQAEESAGRCEWAGDAGNISTGGRVGSLDEECDRLSSEEGYEASTAWLEDAAIGEGCVVAHQDGVGLYEVMAQHGDGVVQVRLALLEKRPLDDVRAALVLLTQQASPGLV